MFQIKDFTSIAASMINHARAATKKITDFQPGSVARTIMEAPAVEIEELYLQMFLGLREAIPVSTFLSFGFDQLPSAYATGLVSVSSSVPVVSDTIIPLDTEFQSADGRVYRSTVALTWEQGSTQITIPVAHVAPGLVGNAGAGVINSSSLFGAAGFVVSNLPITTGRDAETFAEREARFAEYVQSLSRGTLVAIRYAARLASVIDANGFATERVTRIGIDEQAGRVYIYLYSNIGTPSAALLADGQQRIDGTRGPDGIVTGYRAAGVRVDVLAMAEREIPLAVAVEMRSGFSITPAVIQSLSDIFGAQIRAVAPGDTLYLGTLIEAMLAAPGVLSIVPAGNSNFECGVHETLVPGALTVSAL